MEKIVVIDDTSTVRDKVRKVLTNQGFDVLEAENGLLGIEVIKENLDCVLIIVDLNMPIMGGFEMLETLEKEDIALNIPKIIFTTESLLDKDHGKKMKQHGKDLGVKTWFTKPLTAKREGILITTIKKLTEKSH